MTSGHKSGSTGGTPRLPLKYTVAIFCVAFVYLLARPSLERWLGVSLPAPQAATDEPETAAGDETAVDSNSPSDSATSNDGTATADNGDRRDEVARRDTTNDGRGETSPATTRGPPESRSQASDNEPGRLTELQGDVFQSPLGLIYGPGSREGHRLKHVMKHARDNPDRPGSHGVFEGDQDAIVALIDEAWQLAQTPGRRVKSEQQSGRTVHTVDMQRRVGYLGGQNGRRRNHPAARHVRVVLEGKKIITAYPVVQ